MAAGGAPKGVGNDALQEAFPPVTRLVQHYLVARDTCVQAVCIVGATLMHMVCNHILQHNGSTRASLGAAFPLGIEMQMGLPHIHRSEVPFTRLSPSCKARVWDAHNAGVMESQMPNLE